MLKRNIFLIVCLIIFSFSGCGYSAHKQYYNNVDDYNNIWELSGFRHGYEDKSPIFPKKIKDLDIKSFNCRYDEQLPLGEGIQIFLEVCYDDTELNKEVQRIAEFAQENTVNFTHTDFLAYDIRLGEDGCWEYSLIDLAAKKVYYIFVYYLPKAEIEFSDMFLPNNFTDYGEN